MQLVQLCIYLHGLGMALWMRSVCMEMAGGYYLTYTKRCTDHFVSSVYLHACEKLLKSICPKMHIGLVLQAEYVFVSICKLPSFESKS